MKRIAVGTTAALALMLTATVPAVAHDDRGDRDRSGTQSDGRWGDRDGRGHGQRDRDHHWGDHQKDDQPAAADPAAVPEPVVEEPAAPVAPAAPAAPAAPVVPAAPTVVDQNAAEATILQRTNALRATEGKTALVRNTAMDAVAAAWATHMATTGDFRHNPNYASQIPAGWRSAGENIAWNTSDPVGLYTQWQNSAGHRANMVNTSFTDIGIGVVEYNGRYYGVQVFAGYPRGAV